MKQQLFVVSILIGASLLSQVAKASTTNQCAGLLASADETSIREIARTTLNPTARDSADTYRQQNRRNLWLYSDILTGSRSGLQNQVNAGDTVLDIGGGRGVAMTELAEKRGVHATVINPQDYSHLRKAPLKGSVSQKTGFAENILPTIATESIAAAFDVFGAFTYSAAKDDLLEDVYRVLKPSGKAFFVFDFLATPAVVRTDKGDERLDQYLVKKYPEIFSSHRSYEDGLFIIEMRKPDRAIRMRWRTQPDLLSLRLKMIEAKRNPNMNIIVPAVTFQAPN